METDQLKYVVNKNQQNTITQLNELKEQINRKQGNKVIQKADTQSENKDLITNTQLSQQSLISVEKYNQGLKHINKGELKLALQCFEDLIIENPTNKNVWFQIGYVLMNLGQYLTSIKCYDEAISSDPKYIDVFNNKDYRNYKIFRLFINCIALIHILKCFDEAIQFYNLVISFDRKYVNAYFYKGLLLHNLNRFEEAIKCYDQAILLDPKDYLLFKKQR